MATREEIIEELAMVLCHIDGQYWNDLTLTEASDYKKKTELVCLKVNRELPTDTSQAELKRLMHAKIDALEAGYEAVEPLIEG